MHYITNWGWVFQNQAVCRHVTDSLVSANEEIVNLEKSRKVVMAKTMGLHQECESLLREQNLLEEYADALSARL